MNNPLVTQVTVGGVSYLFDAYDRSLLFHLVMQEDGSPRVTDFAAAYLSNCLNNS